MASNSDWNNIAYRQLTGYQYEYDELNRLLKATFNTFGGTSFTALNNILSSHYTYDANGNLKTNIRYGITGSDQNLDNLTYRYQLNAQNKPIHNRLLYVDDAASTAGLADQGANNYEYDAIGNLTRDAQQQTNISWNPYGKVRQVVKDNSAGTSFLYDAAGNRVTKRQVTTTGIATTSYYLRDASGNIMSVYEKVEEQGDVTSFNATEYALYGSDRLGTYSRTIDITSMGGSGETPLEPGEERIMESTTKNAYEGVSYLLNPGVELTLGPGFTFEATGGASFHVRVAAENNGLPELEEGVYARLLNSRKYELKDHLGNVRALVSDVKKSTITNNTPGAYEPDVLALYNYYPFGMEQPGRTWPANNKDYRYGFNGKEKDQNGEWGMTNYDYGFRIYNPAIGKFLSVDPLTKEYPWYTPYQFAGNKPIAAVDLDGLEELVKVGQVDIKNEISLEDYQQIEKALYQEIKIQVKEPRLDEDTWSGMLRIAFTTYEPLTRLYFLDEASQIDHDYGLGGLWAEQGGRIIFNVDKYGEINLNAPHQESYQANGMIRVGSLVRTVNGAVALARTASLTPSLVYKVYQTNIIKNSKLNDLMKYYVREDATLGNGGSADALEYEARTGRMDFSDAGHIQKVAEVRGKLFQILKTETLTSAERTLVIKELTNIQRILRFTFSKNSKYPYNSAAKQAINVLNKQPDF